MGCYVSKPSSRRQSTGFVKNTGEAAEEDDEHVGARVGPIAHASSVTVASVDPLAKSRQGHTVWEVMTAVRYSASFRFQYLLMGTQSRNIERKKFNICFSDMSIVGM